MRKVGAKFHERVFVEKPVSKFTVDDVLVLHNNND